MTPLDGLFSQSVELHRESVALAWREQEWTYGELERQTVALTESIAGVAGEDLRGRRIAIVAPNSPLLVAGLLACWRLNAVAVPLSARLREGELSQILPDAEPVVVLSVAEQPGYRFEDVLPRLLASVASARACLFLGGDGRQAIDRWGRAGEHVEPEPVGEEVASVLYTSGTTGTPKGAVVRHEREVEGPVELASALELGPDDGVALVIPVSHAFGLTCLLSALLAGARTVLVESTLTLAPLVEAVERRGATILHGSPSLFSSLLKSYPGGLSGVRAGFVGGAPAPLQLQERLAASGILNLYGLTETGAVACCRRDDPPEQRRTTAGRPLPGVHVRVVGGELQVRPAGGPVEYLRRPEETAAAQADGWFRTGDLGEIEDGYIRISGREKELIHVGGFNVFPAEVEAALLEHPDVAQAAVVGVPDERMGEALRAFVVPRPGSALSAGALLAFARGRIAGYKLPYSIDLVSELPLLTSGKPDRRALAAR